MGIYDREYIRGGPRSASGFGAMRMWSVNTWIIVINVAVFVIDAMLASSGVYINVNMGDAPLQNVSHEVLREAVPRVDGQGREIVRRTGQYPGSLQVELVNPRTGEVVGKRRYDRMAPLQAMFHFSTGKGFFGLEVWRLVGFQFLHGNLMHIFFNMLGLYFFGGLVENYLGGKRYLAFYLACGVFGGLCYLLLNLLGNIVPIQMQVPGLLINDIYTPLIGASAGVFGVLMAAAFVAPNAVVLFMFIIPMKLWQLAYGFVILAVINLLMTGVNAGGDAAHIGGALAGWYFIRHTHLLRDFFDFFAPRKNSRSRPKKQAKGAPFNGRRTPDDSEIDRILSKIATEGLHSLSAAEKRKLRQATESRKN